MVKIKNYNASELNWK